MKAKPRTLELPPLWPTVVIVVVVILLLVHPTIGADQIKAVETVVHLLAGGGAVSATSVVGRRASRD
ncbi:hypothetical protein [Streptomyces cinerochromogenes]|uniref:hypothetical protein n=1 Tax=Streptomyces cinerochromogenes TaxID=66422 RepID=UPI00166F9946|nr:hypothetical protein [Streptomyces cinerochromogenes]GGS90646.1 hypothetical protein GCM10010206_61810 [Streptomyces cinerochromogenes]